MERFGLVGWPIEHSLSPTIHNAGFKAEQLDYQYELVPISPEVFETDIQTVLHQYRGLNVTTPYKQKIIPYLDSISETAERIQAVNTVYRRPDGRLYGDSTDGAGFWLSSGIQTSQKVVLIGVGGAARAIMASKPQGIDVQVLNRRSAHFTNYQTIVQTLLETDLMALDAFDEWSEIDVVIDATTQGLKNEQAILTDSQLQQLKASARLIDLKYRSTLTPLLKAGKRFGLDVLDGKPMLIEQAILSHQQWIAAKPDRTSMTKSVTNQL